jgi:hypothetical protein
MAHGCRNMSQTAHSTCWKWCCVGGDILNIIYAVYTTGCSEMWDWVQVAVSFSWKRLVEYIYPCRQPHKSKVTCSVRSLVLRLWFPSYAGHTGRSSEDLSQVQRKRHVPLTWPLEARDPTPVQLTANHKLHPSHRRCRKRCLLPCPRWSSFGSRGSLKPRCPLQGVSGMSPYLC